MKKEFLFVVLLLVLFNVIFVISQEGLENVPGGKALGGIEVNEDTGQIKQIEDIREGVDKSRSQNSSYLWEQWKAMPVVGPFIVLLSYVGSFIEGVFSFLDPFWNLIFQSEYVKNFAFFVRLVIFVLLIAVLYFPCREMLRSPVLGFLASLIISMIIGIAGTINRVGVFADAFTFNIWTFFMLLLILLLLFVVYSYFMKRFRKKAEKIHLGRSDKERVTAGDASRKLLWGLGRSTG